jgi:hypothetical protein
MANFPQEIIEAIIDEFATTDEAALRRSEVKNPCALSRLAP